MPITNIETDNENVERREQCRKAEQLLRDLGVAARLTAFWPTVYMLALLWDYPWRLSYIGGLYQDACDELGVGSENMSRNMQYLIDACCDNPDQSLFEEVAGRRLKKRPRAQDFLDMLVTYLRKVN